MSIWKIAWRSIQQRALSSFLTALSMALRVALIVAVLVIHGVVAQSFNRNAAGYDMIVTAKGGALQAVLNTVFHLSKPVENLPYTYYEEFLNTPEHKGKYAKYVGLAIPYCLGDNYEGYRVVGTTIDMFDKLEYAPGTKYAFSAGRNFKADAYFEGVVGATVARKTGLKVGDTFAPTHGVTESEDAHTHDHDPFKVVGILAPTGTPNDRALFVNMEGFFLLEGHALDPPSEAAAHSHDEHNHAHEGEQAHEPSSTVAHEHAAEDAHAHDEAAHDHAHDAAAPATEAAHDHDHAAPAANAQTHDDHAHDAHGHDAHDHAHAHAPLPKSQREVTAILIRSANVTAPLFLSKAVNKSPFGQVVQPQMEIARLFDGLVGNIEMLLVGLATLVVIVAGIGIMVSMYNSMSDRRREIGIMRALGAPRRTIVRVILVESLLLAVGGGVAGFLLGHGLIAAMSPWILDQTGVQIGWFAMAAPIDLAPWLGTFGEGRKLPIPTELMLIGGLALLAQLVGILPAVAAYRTDVGKALSSSP